MEDPNVLERMRADWNQRAGEDAYYYVAFGRRDQDAEEFFATAADVVRLLKMELKRLPDRDAALEIGCGPGRILRPLSKWFGEVHGVDVSDEMIRLAKERLRGVTNAFPRHGTGSDLAMYADGAFDFVYSYAVFQHIPSREVVFQYLREARRVLKDGGILRCQINGLPAHAKRYDTWSGVRIAPEEIQAFAREEDLQLLALEQIWTQYMWVTCRKREAGWTASLAGRPVGRTATIRNIGNAHTGERVAPATGPLAALSVWIHGLPPECDLNHLSVTADGLACRLTYVGEPEPDGVSQVNVTLPEGVRSGLAPVEVCWLGQQIADAGWVRILPGAPPVPLVVSVADGINLLSGTRIVTGTVKVTIEGLADPDQFQVAVDDAAVRERDGFCVDPIGQRHEFNFNLPAGIASGPHEVRVSVGRRRLAPVGIEVAG
jgi:SAM-dependent methyltransferase